MAEAAENDARVVHVIQSRYHYRDADNRPRMDEQILEGEGWFADAVSAAIRCEQLNAQNRGLYDIAMARAKRARDAQIQAAETANREAAILRANGVNKPSFKVPKPFVPVPFESYSPDHAHTSYEVITIRRSDHDGIASALVSNLVSGAVPDKTSTAETDAIESVASGTA